MLIVYNRLLSPLDYHVMAKVVQSIYITLLENHPNSEENTNQKFQFKNITQVKSEVLMAY